MTWWVACHVGFWKFHPLPDFTSSGHFHRNCLFTKAVALPRRRQTDPTKCHHHADGASLDRVQVWYPSATWQHACVCLMHWTGNAHTSKRSLAWLFSSAGHTADITQDAWVLSAGMNYRYLCYQLRNQSIQSLPISRVSSKRSLILMPRSSVDWSTGDFWGLLIR